MADGRSDELAIDPLGWLMLTQQAERANVRSWLGPAGRRQGYGTKAVRLACDFAFSDLDSQVVEANINPDNRPSRALALSLGFTINEVRLTTSADRSGMALLYEVPRTACYREAVYIFYGKLRREQRGPATG